MHLEMARRLIAAVWLFLLLASPLAALVLPGSSTRLQDCNCTERLCRCPHHHRRPTKPPCHFPGGMAPGQFSLQSCSDREERAVSPQTYLPTKPIGLEPSAPVVSETEAVALVLLPVFLETDSPPPRALRA